MNEQYRAYVYRILVAAGVVAIAYGLITQDQVVVWLQLLGTVLATGGVGLAAANTSAKSNQ